MRPHAPGPPPSSDPSDPREGFDGNLSLLPKDPVAVSLWRCAPDSPLWAAENAIGPRWAVAFPWAPVRIKPADDQDTLVNPRHAVCYNPFHAFRRTLASDRGDLAGILSLNERGIRDALASAGLPGHADSVARMPACFASVDPDSCRRMHLLCHGLVRGTASALAASETAADLVMRTITAANASSLHRAAHATDPLRRASTIAAHRDLAEAAKRVLAGWLHASPTLEEVAAACHSSPFHLARVFRAVTGASLAAYHRSLRVRAAVEQAIWTRQPLADLALAFGFATPAHFTTSVRAEFGHTPSQLRAAARRERDL